VNHTKRDGRRFARLAIGVIAAMAIAGVLLGWSHRFGWYDEVIHTLSGVAIALAAGLWLSGGVFGDVSQRLAAYVWTLTVIGLGVGAGWEIIEFAYDHLNGARDSIRGKADTISDLVCGGAGAIVGGCWMATLQE
jgi:hypothetical protein